MPRASAIRKDLRLGLTELHELWRLPLSRKIDLSLKCIEATINAFERPALAWSGGKDSTVLLHLVMQFNDRIPIIFVDTGVLFPETVSFVRSLSHELDLNIHCVKPIPEEDFWKTTDKYGWPIMGKSIAQSVGKANRSGNIRNTMSRVEKELAIRKIHISGKCMEYTLEKPAKKKESELAVDVKFVGLMASESFTRIRLFVDHGTVYKVKHYYGRNKPITKACPLYMWREDDIWEYMTKYNVPYCSLYDMGHTRNGCWTCAMGFRYGQLKRLRNSHPHLFDELILNTRCGAELFKIKNILSSESNSKHDISELKTIIAKDPAYFDRI